MNTIFAYNDEESEKVIALDAQECTKPRAEKMVREKAHEINLIHKIDTESLRTFKIKADSLIYIYILEQQLSYKSMSF